MKQIKEMLISIVIPVYKVEQYLDRCVNSLVNQAYKNLEIILVDDGSPDNCPKMCDEWAKKDERIKVIHKENGGVGSARNEGIKRAEGDYITFVDSDDWVNDDFSKALELVNLRTDLDMISFGYIKNKQKKNIFDNLEFNIQNNEEFVKYYSLKNDLLCWNRIIKLNTLKQNKIYFGINGKGQDMGEDFEWIFRVSLECKKVLMTDIAYYVYFLNESSATQTPNLKKIIAHFENMQSVVNQLELRKFTKQQKGKILSNIFEVNYAFLKISSKLSKLDRKEFVRVYKNYKKLFVKPQRFKLKLVWLILKLFGVKFTMFALKII